MKNKQKIGLIFVGGTHILDKTGNLLIIEDQKDMKEWLANIPELDIMADIEPILVMSEKEVLTPIIWEKLSKTIRQKSEDVDAFVVITRLSKILNLATATGFLLQNINKSIIFTASNLQVEDKENVKKIIADLKKNSGAIGLKSNLINSFQVATYDLPAPAVVFGTRIIAATKAMYDNQDKNNAFISVDKNYWGLVDFGINIKTDLHFSHKAESFYDKIMAEILVLEDLAGIGWHFNSEDLKNYQAVIIRLADRKQLSPAKQKQVMSWDLPVVLYNAHQNMPSENMVSLSDCTWNTALTKTMWAVANLDSLGNFREVITKQYIGEYNI